MHVSSRLNKVHPEELLPVALCHAQVPLAVRGVVAIAVVRQRLREAVGLGVVGEVDDEVEGVVVDDFVAELGEGGCDGRVGLSDDHSPRGHAVGGGTAEVLGCHGRDVLGVDIRDEDVGRAVVEERGD